MAWNLITNLKGGKGDKGDTGNFFMGNLPSGNMINRYGPEYTGLWAVPTPSAADAISGKPSGAGPGNVLILPVGSTASTQTWTEYTEPGRSWTCGISNGNRISPWKETTSGAHYGNIELTTITHIDNIGHDSEYSIWSGSKALSMGAPVAAVCKVKTEMVGSLAMQTVKTMSAVSPGPETYTRARGSSGWSPFYKIHPVDTSAPGMGGGASSGFKSAALALSQQSAGGTESVSAATVRWPIVSGVASQRARLHIQNRNYYSGTKYAGAVSFTGAWFGRASGKNFTGNPSRLLSSFNTPSNGDEYVSPWFALDLEQGAEHLLSVGFTNAPGQVNVQSRGGCYRSASASDAPLASGFTGATSTDSPFDVWLELEVPADTPIVAGFGDSNTVATGTTLPVFDSWLSQYCREAGAVPYFMSVHGSTSASWKDPSKGVWSHYSGAAKPDSTVYFLGQNDLQEGVPLATLQASFSEVLDVVRHKLSTDVFVATITPANNKSVAVNMLRRSYNSWLKALPFGVKDCFDFSAAVSDDDATIRAVDNYDGLHMKTSGHTKMAAKLLERPITPPVSASVDTGPRSVATIAALPAANTGNRGVIIFVVSENKPYYSNGTAWGPVATGAQGDPGPAGAGVPDGGAAGQIVRRNSTNTTTYWETPDKYTVGLDRVDNTPDAQKPVSGPQWEVFAEKADLVGGKVPASQIPAQFTEDPANPGYLLIGG